MNITVPFCNIIINILLSRTWFRLFTLFCQLLLPLLHHWTDLPALLESLPAPEVV